MPGGTRDDADALRGHFAEVLLAAAPSLQPGPDTEFALDALIEVAVVQGELRDEQVE